MENNEDKLIYYILREEANEPGDAFSLLIDDLKRCVTGTNVILEKPGVVIVSGDSIQKGVIENNPPEISEKFTKFKLKAKLILNKEDSVNLQLIKYLAAKARVKYRIFSTLYNCFLPTNPNLINEEFGIRDEKLAKIFSQFGLKPLFFNKNFGSYYAQKQNGQVVIVNQYLIDFLYGKDIPEQESTELYYVVAPNLEMFCLKYDQYLIPKNFYEYFGKSFKIINNSCFEIDNPGRKVFIKPYIFELREELGEFYKIADDEGQALLAMDKIRPGETLDKTLKRIVSEDLKIAPDYIGAFVSEEIEFDRDRDGIITPRLVVFVYVNKIEKERSKVLQMSQTGWKSTSGAIPKVNLNPDFENISN